jgi:hypothetical protein
VNRVLRAAVIDKKSDYGWALQVFPPDGFMQILSPFGTAADALQYNQNLLTKAWGYWSGVPARCAEIWNSDYYFGMDDGRVVQYYGTLDNVLLDGTPGVSIEFNILTSFQPYGQHGFYKQAGMFRIVGVSAGAATYRIRAVYDYDIEAEAGTPTGVATSDAAVWGTAIWGTDVWGAQVAGSSVVLGTAGIGRTVALAMTGYSSERMTIVAWDGLLSDMGNFL